MPKSRRSDPQESLGIGEASRLLGVSEVTLRHWTDESQIQAFVTPGGHRRYLRRQLDEFVQRQQRVHGIKDLIAKIEDTPAVHRQLAQTYLSTTSWFSKIDRETQKRIAVYGRRILELVVRYIASPRERENIAAEVREVGHQFGTTLASLGLSLTDCIEAFILHRTPVVNAATELLGEAVNGRVVKAMPLVTQIMDEALVPLVAAHQSYSKNAPDSDHQRND